MKKFKNNIEICFFIIINLFFSCKNNTNETIPSEKKVVEKKLTIIDHFLFFKQGMSYDEVVNVLKQNQIKFQNITYKESYIGSDLNPTELSYISKTGYDIKFIQGKSLKLLDTEIPEFQIFFINNKIVHFFFNSTLSETRGVFKELKVDINYKRKIDEKLKRDLMFIQILYNSLKEKYGEPSIKGIGLKKSIDPTNDNVDNPDDINPNYDNEKSPKNKTFYCKWWGDCPGHEGSASSSIEIGITRKHNSFFNDNLYYETNSHIDINFEFDLQNKFFDKIDSMYIKRDKEFEELNNSRHKEQIKKL